MTHRETRSPARSRTTLDYDRKIVDSQRIRSAVLRRGYDARRIGS